MKVPKSVLTVASLSIGLGVVILGIGIWALSLGDFRMGFALLTVGSVTAFSALEIARGKTRGYNDLSVGLFLTIFLTFLMALFGFIVGGSLSGKGLVYTLTTGGLCMLSTGMLVVLRSSSVSRWVVERQLDEI